MVAVRCAARRLGGSLLQRAQGVVSEEGRRLMPSKLMRSRHFSTQAPSEKEGSWLSSRLGEVSSLDSIRRGPGLLHVLCNNPVGARWVSCSSNTRRQTSS